MACPSLLRSATSSFHGQFPVVVSPPPLRLSYGNPRNGGGLVMPVKASAVVLVEKSEAEKVSRLKTTYLEKIVPQLKEEFSYTNIHQVNKTHHFNFDFDFFNMIFVHFNFLDMGLFRF